MKYIMLVTTLFLGIPSVVFADTIIDITFPVAGEVTFTDTFDAARSGGRTHDATDIMAEKMTPVLAAASGIVDFAPTTEPYYGFMLSIDGDDGYTYNYVHLNNDTPGTDDGQGSAENAYAPGIQEGVRVERGQHIAWVGDSGNAEWVGSHLHFEIETSDGVPINPYESLLAAQDQSLPVAPVEPIHVEPDPEPSFTLETYPELSINDDKSIAKASGEVNCDSGTLIRTPEVSTVYYCGRDGGRYVFQNEGTYFSWYDNFDSVQYVTAEIMASIPLSGVVTYKPGSFMIKILSSPKVYTVEQGGVLRWVTTEAIALDLYGADWASYVRDIPDGFFAAYEVGADFE